MASNAPEAVSVNTLDLVEAWLEGDESARWRSSFPFTPSFPLFTGVAAEEGSAVYFEVDAGRRLADHQDSAEEIVIVLEGEGEFHVEGDAVAVKAGDMLVIPADANHGARNTGDATLRVLGFFASAEATTTFEDVIQPFGFKSTADAPPAPPAGE